MKDIFKKLYRASSGNKNSFLGADPHLKKLQKKKNTDIKNMIAIVVIIVVILGAAGTYLTNLKNDSNSADEKSKAKSGAPETDAERNIDADLEGLPDYMEKVLGTNETKADTDGDGYNDLLEVINGYNPLSTEKYTEDEWKAVKDKIRTLDEFYYEGIFGNILRYKADLSNVPPNRKGNAMHGVQEIIKMKIQGLGVENPAVEIRNDKYISIDVSGIVYTDLIKEVISKTPSLDFRIESSREEYNEYLKSQNEEELPEGQEGPYYIPTELTGKHILSSSFDLNQENLSPVVNLEFNEEGKKIFADLTSANVGKNMGVFLEGRIITSSKIREALTDGKAVIEGSFSEEEALSLANKLNGGAFPVPIRLVSD